MSTRTSIRISTYEYLCTICSTVLYTVLSAESSLVVLLSCLPIMWSCGRAGRLVLLYSNLVISTLRHRVTMVRSLKSSISSVDAEAGLVAWRVVWVAWRGVARGVWRGVACRVCG